jgi:NADH-quinone oxidoreductase subunit M
LDCVAPLIGLVIVGFIPVRAGGRHVDVIRWVTLGITLLTLGLAAGLWASFDHAVGGPQFVDRVEWIPSLLLLVGIVDLYQVGGTFDILALMQVEYAPKDQFWIFLALLLGFAIKVPMLLVHSWLADVH